VVQGLFFVRMLFKLGLRKLDLLIKLSLFPFEERRASTAYTRRQALLWVRGLPPPSVVMLNHSLSFLACLHLISLLLTECEVRERSQHLMDALNNFPLIAHHPTTFNRFWQYIVVPSQFWLRRSEVNWRSRLL
jgi:hypothetical protein